jgi:hypothetical protein
MKKTLLLKTALAIALVMPLLASAESVLNTTGPGPSTAAARLDFRVIVPRVLFLAVGTGATGSLATNNTIDALEFNYSTNAADVGSGTDSAAQSIDVRVRGNNGQIQLAAASLTTGLVSDLDPNDIILWAEILAVSIASEFEVPAVGASTTPTLNGGKVTNRSTKWNYAYSNTNIAAPGLYDVSSGT